MNKRNQFNQLFVEFTRDKKHEHGLELTVLLDGMSERGTITPLEYNKLNSVIAIPGKSSDEGTEGDEMPRVIKVTVDHVIQHDKGELSDLLMELREEVGKEYFLDALLDLELLAGKFLFDEFQEPLFPLIEERRLKLEATPASLTKLFPVKMLSDKNNNRCRVQELFQRIYRGRYLETVSTSRINIT